MVLLSNGQLHLTATTIFPNEVKLRQQGRTDRVELLVKMLRDYNIATLFTLTESYDILIQSIKIKHKIN